MDCGDGDPSEVDGKLRLTLLLHFGVLRWEGVSFDVFDDRVGDGCGGISLDCDDRDSSEVDGKL